MLLSNFAQANSCYKTHFSEKDSFQQLLQESEKNQRSYRQDLIANLEMDPYFIKNFLSDRHADYSIHEVRQNYLMPQAKSAIENILSRLEYIRNNLKTDPKIYKYYSSKNISLTKYQSLIDQGQKILKEEKYSYAETMDFLEQGLVLSGVFTNAEHRNSLAIHESGYKDTSYANRYYIDRFYQNYNKSLNTHGSSDPFLLNLFSQNSGRAFHFGVHPALASPLFINDRLFTEREFNWAFAKGSFLTSISPHKPEVVHGVISTPHFVSYHDLSGHYKGAAIAMPIAFLQKIYKSTGRQQKDQAHNNFDQLKELLVKYIELREDFLSALIKKAESTLSEKEQKKFHETLFEALHENGAIPPVPGAMISRFKNAKTLAEIFIKNESLDYQDSHDLTWLERN